MDESWQSKQLVYTTNHQVQTKRNIKSQQQKQNQIRGHSSPRSVSFRSYEESYVDNLRQDEEKQRNVMEASPILIGHEQTSVSRQQVVEPIGQIEEGRDFYHYNNEIQHQFFNSNNNDSDDSYSNNNENSLNNSSVKLLITPAVGNLPEGYGSNQQQMAFPSQNTINFQAKYNNNRSQQQQSRQKNYQHYDYYTDSELASSQGREQVQQLNHYDDENTLLFATEHDNNGNSTRSSTNGSQQKARVSPETLQTLQSQQVVNNSTRAKSTTHHHYSSLYHAPSSQTGKFVNYYPSWRQAQSPASHYQNYSFHVPLNQQQHYLHHQQQPLYQPRYSFVTPVERVFARPGGGFKHSFKSRTISHIPNMVKISVEEKTIPPNNNDLFQDYYDKPSSLIGNGGNQNTKSEGDLLKAHVIDLKQDKGHDNPFKPGTELSWEAEMMVRLMKRGYPIQELPVLVETAKHLAKERKVLKERIKTKTKINEDSENNSSAKGNVESDELNEQVLQNKNKASSNESQTLTKAVSKTTQRINQKSETSFKLRSQLSQSDLSSGKQVWVNSLSRTKSMPRFSNYYSNQNQENDMEKDGVDSIDKLIISIENEVANLADEATTTDDNERLIRNQIGATSQTKTSASNKVPKDEKLQVERRANDYVSGSSAAAKSNRQTRLEVENAKKARRKQPDLNRTENKSKNKKACCIIH